MKRPPLYRCFGCGYFATAKELAEHRGEHHAMGMPDASFWQWYHAKWGIRSELALVYHWLPYAMRCRVPF